MTKSKMIIKGTGTACAFGLLVLILDHEVLCVEGRHLKSEMCKKCSILQTGENALTRANKLISKVVEFVNDFQPTAPGHSPGIGHSINN
ncbi:hypothetical protein I3760_01G020000 [Carya illinoinensis]|uniref:Uncharacterized protein n=1 Tax=Carya illinoinensis TaxID=32201 RepID=A0A922G0M5_CARIL|nr:hypothetical protein I3760_01G020000 [Carya illinoinensis]KAG6729281.1 hypothetical protein I3842_01G020100 [Carya illinoinensis]